LHVTPFLKWSSVRLYGSYKEVCPPLVFKRAEDILAINNHPATTVSLAFNADAVIGWLLWLIGQCDAQRIIGRVQWNQFSGTIPRPASVTALRLKISRPVIGDLGADFRARAGQSLSVSRHGSVGAS
jgi:hypothetical protein